MGGKAVATCTPDGTTDKHTINVQSNSNTSYGLLLQSTKPIYHCPMPQCNASMQCFHAMPQSPLPQLKCFKSSMPHSPTPHSPKPSAQCLTQQCPMPDSSMTNAQCLTYQCLMPNASVTNAQCLIHLCTVPQFLTHQCPMPDPTPNASPILFEKCPFSIHHGSRVCLLTQVSGTCIRHCPLHTTQNDNRAICQQFSVFPCP